MTTFQASPVPAPAPAPAAAPAPAPAPLDQAERLRALVREIVEGKPLPHAPWAERKNPDHAAGACPVPPPETTPGPRAATLAIASGKGGVGKTTLAVNLAAALALRSHRVCLIDGDLGLGNADVLLGLNPRLNLAHLLNGAARLEEILFEAQVGSDVEGERARFVLLPGGSGLADLADLDASRRDRLAQLLRELESRFDLLIIDCGAGIGASVLAFVRAADAALIVTTPEPTAITDAYALIKCLRLAPAAAFTDPLAPDRAPGEESPAVALVVNQADDAPHGASVQSRIESVCARFLGFTPACAGAVRHDRAARAAVCRRRPLLETAPSSAAAQDIRDLSGFVASLCRLHHAAAAPPPQRRGLVARLLRSVTRR